MTSVQGVNVINIAFGDYSEGISGHETTEEIIKEGVRAIHDKVLAGQYHKKCTFNNFLAIWAIW